MRNLWLVGGAAATLLACVAGCGGESDPVCGNDIEEEGEQCDDGNTVNGDGCTAACLKPLVQTDDVRVKWAFNKAAAPRFDTDSCFDMTASRVVVELDGPGGPYMAEESCGLRQVTFPDLGPGNYTARVHVNDSSGQLLTASPVEYPLTVVAGQGLEEHEVAIGYDLWRRDYTGTFFFRLVWGGADCVAAQPPVVQHNLLLEVAGAAVSQVTDVGDRVDGSTPAPCRAVGEQFPQSVLDVPWGPATFTVIGLDSAGGEQYRDTYDTFVGAGVSNPDMEFDVGSVQADAAVPDSGPQDSGT